MCPRVVVVFELVVWMIGLPNISINDSNERESQYFGYETIQGAQILYLLPTVFFAISNLTDSDRYLSCFCCFSVKMKDKDEDQ